MTDETERLPASTNPADLTAGDPHYRAYVGPPLQYDFMGATQFRLLCTLGLRSSHRVLDFGCGSLRAGRLLIPYLDPGNYHGIEPNPWLIEQCIDEEIGRDLIRLKRPRFDHNKQFDPTVFGTDFDYIVAQSIFSHCGPRLIVRGLTNLAAALRPGGRLLATFSMSTEKDNQRNGWKYPGVCRYRAETLEGYFADAGVEAQALPWFHPRQRWYCFGKSRDVLPSAAQLRFLHGAVLNSDEFAASLDG